MPSAADRQVIRRRFPGNTQTKPVCWFNPYHGQQFRTLQNFDNTKTQKLTSFHATRLKLTTEKSAISQILFIVLCKFTFTGGVFC
jgi:hypothetical protein